MQSFSELFRKPKHPVSHKTSFISIKVTPKKPEGRLHLSDVHATGS